jgi:ribosomal protein S18 acetylase RimI-like enzyme
MDYKQYPEKTQMFMALDSQKKIHGIFIIWRNHTIQIRGSREASKLFIDYLKEKKVDIHQITGPIHLRSLLNKEYPKPLMTFQMDRMTLRKGQEKIQESYKYIQLNDSHKEDIAAFIQNSDPKYFGSFKAEDIMMDQNHPYFAVMEKQQIISIAGLWIDEIMGIISIIATDPDYRRQGHAYSMVSTGVKWLFNKTDKILIHVRDANAPAIHTYEKAGYKNEFSYDVITLKE